MSRLPSCKAAEVARALAKVGFVEEMGRGGHRSYYRERDKRVLTIAWHSGDLKRGTLAAILKQAGLSQDEFIALL